jgi:transcriptional regulator with PAS, ATPase and Fis domain
MRGLLITAVSLPGIALVAAIVYGIVVTQDKNVLSIEVAQAESSLATVQVELDVTQDILTSREAELDEAEETLASAQAEQRATERSLTAALAELDSVEAELASTQQQLATTQQQLATKQDELASANQALTYIEQTQTGLEDELAATQQQLDVALETLDGLGITLSASRDCYDVNLIDNPEATNPTLNELKAFLAQDRTEYNQYIGNVYDCSQFSRDVHNNAEAAGIRAAEVQIFFRGEWTGHALNAFITTDYGLVYVDCTEEPDAIARVKVGKEYRSLEVYLVSPANIRNDAWWDNLGSYYYFSCTIFGGHCVTDEIEIFW